MSGARVQDPCHPLCALLWAPGLSPLWLSISFCLPSYGHLVFHHTLSLSAGFWADGIPPPLFLSATFGPLVLDPYSPLSAKLCSVALSSLPLYVPTNVQTYCVSLHWLGKTRCGHW